MSPTKNYATAPSGTVVHRSFKKALALLTLLASLALADSATILEEEIQIENGLDELYLVDPDADLSMSMSMKFAGVEGGQPMSPKHKSGSKSGKSDHSPPLPRPYGSKAGKSGSKGGKSGSKGGTSPPTPAHTTAEPTKSPSPTIRSTYSPTTTVSPTETTTLSIDDQLKKEILDGLEKECMGHDESEVCTFFENYNDPDVSGCICSTKSITDEELEESKNLVSISLSCEEKKESASFWLSVGGSVVNIGLAWASFGASTGIQAALWATLGEGLGEGVGTLSSGVDAWKCNANQLILQDWEQTEAYVGEKANMQFAQLSADTLNIATTIIDVWKNEETRTIPFRKMDLFVNDLNQVSVIAAQGGMAGATLIAETAIASQFWAQKRVSVRPYDVTCRLAVNEYKANIRLSIELLDNIKTRFSTRFSNLVQCNTNCKSGGCLCFFCGNSNIGAKCRSSIASSAEFNFDLERSCANCSTAEQEKRTNEARSKAEVSWTAAVNKWWNDDIKEAFDLLNAMLSVAENMMNVCNNRCGPDQMGKTKRCEVGASPYCNLEVGGCQSTATTNLLDRQYDALE